MEVNYTKLLDDLKKTIRSLLLSCKEGRSTSHLAADYRELMGSEVPYRRLGCANLELLLSKMPDVCKRSGAQGEIWRGVADQSTAHIAALVSKQKSKNLKKRSKFMPSRKPTSNYSYRPSHVPKQAYSRQSNSNHKSSTPSLHSHHNQYTNFTITLVVHSEQQVKENLRSLLSGKTGGIWLHHLPDMYKHLFNAVLPDSIEKKILYWTDILTAEMVGERYILYEKKLVQTPAPPVAFTTAYKCDFEGVKISSPDLLVIGTEYPVYVAHVDVGCIYLHCHDSDVDAIRAALADHFTTKTAKSYPSIPTGCVCAAKDSKYQKWSRAFVNSSLGSQVKVFYVDYGNSEQLTPSSIQPLPSQLAKYPAQAIPVVLHNLSILDHPKFTQELIRLTDHNLLLANIDSVLDGKCSVTLYTATHSPINLNKKLVSLGVANWADAMLASSAPQSSSPGVASSSVHSTLSGVRLTRASPASTGVQLLPAITPRVTNSTTATASVNISIKNLSIEEPDALILPESGYWSVIVTHIVSTRDLFLRVETDSSADYAKFMEGSAAVYSDKSQFKAPILNINDMYMAFVVDEEGENWYRIRLLDIVDKQQALCEFVDYGYEEVMETNSLYQMIAEYRAIPFQAVQCALYGLDHIIDSKLTNKLIELTLNKTLIAEVISKEGGRPVLVLFDTSTTEDLEINKLLGELVKDQDLDTELPAVGESAEVHLTYITPDGTLYVQLAGPGILALKSLMDDLHRHYKETRVENFISKPEMGQMVCAKYDGYWYRAIIKELHTEAKKVTVFYCDYGNTETVKNSSIRKLNVELQHATTLPPQALACTLDGLDQWNDSVMAAAVELMNTEAPLNIRTVAAASSTSPARVELLCNGKVINEEFIRIYYQSLQEDDEKSTSTSRPITASAVLQENTSQTAPEALLNKPPLHSVNNSFEKQMRANENIGLKKLSTPHMNADQGLAATGDAESFDSLSKLLMSDIKATNVRPEGGYSAQLQPVDITQHFQSITISETPQPAVPAFVSPPAVGECWDVFVTYTNDPGLFVVVPLENMNKHNAMQDAIHEKYMGSVAVPFEPVVGQLYAALCSDGYWYRVQLQEGMISEKFKVLYVDYGNYDYVYKDVLRPLYPEFYARELQAVQAHLAAVEPARGNIWSDRAKQDFIELCNEKKLVSIVQSVKQESGGQASVTLHLFDTITDPIIDIARELVKMGHALYSKH